MTRALMRTAVTTLLAVAAGGCALPATAVHRAPNPGATAPRELRIRVVEAGRTSVRRVPLEEYVRASVVSEFAPASGDPAIVERMLEVQAVLSRTYALSHIGRHAREGYDLCATTHCQLFEPSRLRTSRWAAAATAAVRKTAGAVLWYEGKPAAVLFHADCGGHTSAPARIWGGTAQPYLRAAADDGAAKKAHRTWLYDVRRGDLRLALNRDARTAVGARLESIRIIARDEAGRAIRVRLEGRQTREVAGEVLRAVLTRALGVRTIRSTLFEVRSTPAGFVFEGRGFGHGAGLCQMGAYARIAAGARPAAVLLRYFPGTRLLTMS